MKPGEATLAEHDAKRSANGLYVTELIGRGPNMVTGDYSRGASGFWIENGEVAFPVSEVTLAGKLRRSCFCNLTPANDLEFRTADQRAHLPRRRNDLGGR